VTGQVVPPRDHLTSQVARADLERGPTEPRELWYDQIEALVPPQAVQNFLGSRYWTWSNPLGVWNLATNHHERFQVVVYRGFKLGDSDRRWLMDDPSVDHLRSVLQVLGAIPVLPAPVRLDGVA
jgi:hypothetical protein